MHKLNLKVHVHAARIYVHLMDVHTINIYIYQKFLPFNSLVWGSLMLSPIMSLIVHVCCCTWAREHMLHLYKNPVVYFSVCKEELTM